MARLAVTRELVGNVVCSSYVAHQKVKSYSWILAINRAYSPLKSTSSTTAFNHQNGCRTCQLHLRVRLNSQLDPPLVASLCRLVVLHSVASYVIRYGHKSVASHSLFFFISITPLLSDTGNSRRSRHSRRSVSNRSQSITSQSKVDRKCITASGRGRGSGARVYADRLTNGLRGLRTRKSVVVRSRVTLIIWPIIHFFIHPLMPVITPKTM